MRAPTQLPARLRGPGAVAVPQPGGGAPGARGAAASLWQAAGKAEFMLFAYSAGHPHGVLQLFFILDSHKTTYPGPLCFPLVRNQRGSLSNAAIQPLELPRQLSRNAQGRGVRHWHCHITACVSSRAPSHPDEQTSLRAWPLSQGLPLP